MQKRPTLYIFGGLPGVGKTTLTKQYSLNQLFNKNELQGFEGYELAYKMAADNLNNGNSIIVDSVNPIEITRSAWRNVAAETNANFLEIEIICSDLNEHKNRVENRVGDIVGMILPTWKKVIDRNYEQWQSAGITIDTTNKNVKESLQDLEASTKSIGF